MVNKIKYAFTCDEACEIIKIPTATYFRRKKSKDQQHESISEKEVAMIKEILLAEHVGNQVVYGKRKHKKNFANKYNLQVSERRVSYFMKELGLRSQSLRNYRKPNKATINAKKELRINHLNYDFSANNINEKWLTDITYTYFNNGKNRAYLSTIMDVYSRKIIAWTLSDTQDVSLVLDTLNEAIVIANPPRGLILHSDQGTQYTSYEYEELAKQHGIIQSFNLPENPQHNAVIESFHSSLKGEWFNRYKAKDFTSLKTIISEYISWYNNHRIHSSIGYMTPSRKHDEGKRALKEKTGKNK